MAFWSTLGKGLLKAAPIAASFIPGVGPLAAAGIGALTGGIDAKINKQNPFLGAAFGAGMGAIGGKMNSPTSYIGRDVGNVARSGLGPSNLGRLLKPTVDIMRNFPKSSGFGRPNYTPNYRTPPFVPDYGYQRGQIFQPNFRTPPFVPQQQQRQPNLSPFILNLLNRQRMSGNNEPIYRPY